MRLVEGFLALWKRLRTPAPRTAAGRLTALEKRVLTLIGLEFVASPCYVTVALMASDIEITAAFASLEAKGRIRPSRRQARAMNGEIPARHILYERVR